jgi:hypothetical protein
MTRRGTPNREPAAPIFTTVQGYWPITRAVFRDASTVEVGLLDEKSLLENSGQAVVMRKVGAMWSVVGLLLDRRLTHASCYGSASRRIRSPIG